MIVGIGLQKKYFDGLGRGVRRLARAATRLFLLSRTGSAKNGVTEVKQPPVELESKSAPTSPGGTRIAPIAEEIGNDAA